MHISGSTRVIGFIGASDARSRMFGIYNAAFRAMDLDFVYVPLRATDVAQAADAVRALGLHAIGVTIPFKVSIIDHLDAIDDSARRSGAVNVVVNDGGRLLGSNTDGQGALRAIEEKSAVAGRHICLLGGGGAARAIAAELVGAGAHVIILGIDAAETEATARDTGGTMRPWDQRASLIAAADIVINATPVGMAGTAFADDTPVAAGVLSPRQVVMDIIAAPRETRLLREAKARGLSVIPGERMLLWQALLKFPFFTGREVTIQQLEAAMGEAERD